MLFLAAIIYAGTIATSTAHTHGTFPQGGQGTVTGTRVTIERRFPAVPPKQNAVTNMQRAQEANKEQQDACSRLKMHRLSQNGPAPQALARCQARPGTP